MLRKPFLIIPSSGDWILAIGSISEGNKSVDVHAKTQRKRHAKSAQLHFEIFAFPFVTSAITSSLGLHKGR